IKNVASVSSRACGQDSRPSLSWAGPPRIWPRDSWIFLTGARAAWSICAGSTESSRFDTGTGSTRDMPAASRSERIRVRAIFFDLFDTLVRFDRERLPQVEIAGRRVRTTAGHLHPILRTWAPDVTLEAFHTALLESWQEAERRRAVDHREVTAPERFVHLFRCLALDPEGCPPGLLQSLL